MPHRIKGLLISKKLKDSYFLINLILYCALFALSFGLYFGISDQNVYLLRGIHLADHSFLPNDWFVSNTIHHHKTFTNLIYLIVSSGLPLDWTCKALHFLLMAMVGASAYLILAGLFNCLRLSFILSTVVLHLAVGTFNILSHPFLVPWLLPTNISSGFFLAAIAVWTHADRPSRFGITGLLFGLSSLFHGTFLLLTPLFLLILIFLFQKKLSYKNLLIFCTPYIFLILPNLCTLLSKFSVLEYSQNMVAELDTLARVRVPHHYLPQKWNWTDFSVFVKCILLGGIGFIIATPTGIRVKSVFYSILAIVIVSALILICTLVIFLPEVALWLPYRFIALLTFFSLLLFSGAIVQQFQVRITSIEDGVKLFLLSCGLVIVWGINKGVFTVLLLLFSLWFSCNLIRLEKKRTLQLVHTAIIAFSIIFLIWQAAITLPDDSPFPIDEEENVLFSWVKANTTEQALFVVPIYKYRFQGFRLQAQRSIVVDWKAHPFEITGFKEWFRRIALVSGVHQPFFLDDVANGYQHLDSQRAQKLYAEFGAMYFVVDESKHKGSLDQLERVYAHGKYAVYFLDKNRLGKLSE